MRNVTIGKLIHELSKFDKDADILACGCEFVHLYTDEKRSYVSIEMQQNSDYGKEIEFEKHDEDIFDNPTFRRRKLISALNRLDADFEVQNDEISFIYENGNYVVDCAEDKATFNGHSGDITITVNELITELGGR